MIAPENEEEVFPDGARQKIMTECGVGEEVVEN